jgi:hypothetical protein
VEEDVERRAADSERAVILGNEPQLAEFVDEKADARARRADHFGQALLADFGDHRFGFPILPKTGKPQQSPRQALSDERGPGRTDKSP